MKKRIILGMLLLLNGFIFAESFLKDYATEFLNKGSYVVVNNYTDYDFFPKHIIARIKCDEDDLSITYIDSECDYETVSFNIKKYVIQLDENCNIIIIKK